MDELHYIPTKSNPRGFSNLVRFVNKLACPYETEGTITDERVRFRTLKAAVGLFAEIREWENDVSDLSEAADIIFWCIELNSCLEFQYTTLPAIPVYNPCTEEAMLLIDIAEKFARAEAIRPVHKKVKDARHMAELARNYFTTVLDCMHDPTLYIPGMGSAFCNHDPHIRYTQLRRIEALLYKKLGDRHCT